MNDELLVKIFNESVKSPFTYNITFKGKTAVDLFKSLKNMLYLCLNIRCQKDKLNEVTYRDLEIVSEYMLSFGIKVNFKELDADDINYYHKSLLYELEEIKELQMIVAMNWRTSHIQKIQLVISDNKGKQEVLRILKKHFISNFFIQLYQPTNLHDVPLIIHNLNGKTGIIYFDFAEPTHVGRLVK